MSPHIIQARPILLGLGLSTLSLVSLSAAPGELSSDVEALKAQISALEQKVRIIERKGELDREAAEAKAKSAPAFKYTPGGGAEFAGPDKSWSLKLNGLIHTDARHFITDTATNNQDRFLFRRVRPTFQGTVGDWLAFRVTPEIGANAFELLDATATIKFDPTFNLTVGKFKGPVGWERLVSGSALPFIERGYPTALLPNRDLGVNFHGKLFSNKLDYSVAITNGTPDGGSTSTNATDDNS